MNKVVVLTEEELRSSLLQEGDVYRVSRNAYITASAKSYARERGITIEITESDTSCIHNEEAKYVDAVTSQTYSHKPEDMTHLFGNQLVNKTDPRIAFRGLMDTMKAFIVRLGVIVKAEGNTTLYRHLGELLSYTRSILEAEVKDQALGEIELIGMDADALRAHSHDRDGLLAAHPLPCAEQGLVAAELNLLRTKVRETELCAVKALPARIDIIQALNRLSSAVYILYCRVVAEIK